MMVTRQTRYCTAFGLCLGLFSLVFGIFWDKIFYNYIEKILILSTDSPIYELWHKPPMKMILDLYLFNWTNPQDFRNPAIKPKFQELGPYSYSESDEKVDMVWHAENSTVSYRRKTVFHFNEKGTRGSLDDVITTINSVAVSTASIAQHFSATQRTLAEFAMMVYPRDLTVKKTVDEMLFTGFKDTLLSLINALPSSSFGAPFDRYGYCYGRNNSADFFGTFNVHTGADNIKNLGQIIAWNQKNYSEFYNSSCARIKGSVGEFLGPHLKPKDAVSLFGRELCRDMPLEFDNITYVEGVKGFKYIAGLRAIDNGTLYPENACFCNGQCLPSGVINISSCWFNTPVFMSYPHFYKADPYYLSQLEGLEPHQEKHELTYTVEPETSIPLQIVARSQMNIFVQPIQRSRMFHDVRKIMFPLFWVEVRTGLTPDLFAYLRTVANIIYYGKVVAGVLCVFGFLLALIYPILYKIRYKVLPKFETKDFVDVHEIKTAHTIDLNQNSHTKPQKREEKNSTNGRQPLL